MRLLINTSVQRFGGGIQVALSFINECTQFPENEYHVFVGAGIQKLIDVNKFPSNFFFYFFDYGRINLLKTIRINDELNRYENKIKPDCVITTTGPSYWKPKAPHVLGFNLPLYIYPESPYLQDLSLFSKLKLHLRKFIHTYFFTRDANVYVVQTEDVNNRVKKLLGNDHVFTVTNNHSSLYYDWEKFPNKIPIRTPDRKFRFLTLTSWYPHKNLEIIPEIETELQRRGINNVEFVLTLEDDDFKKIMGDSRSENILNAGPVKPSECPSLYDECDFLFHPTLAECFSAAYPEAMIMKKPIITTALGFAKSICGDAALYYKPKDAVNAADVIEKLINDANLQAELIIKGNHRLNSFHSPSERAEKYLEICNRIVSEQVFS